MITKIFWFQFVNSYASFFYLAFIAESLGDCPVDGCMKGLTINLAIIFGTRLIVGNIMELGIPYVSYWYKYREETKRAKGDMSQAEKEYLLDPVRAYICVCVRSYLCVFSSLFLSPLFVCSGILINTTPILVIFVLVRSNVVQPRGLRGGGDRLRLHGVVRVCLAHGGCFCLCLQRSGGACRWLEDPQLAPTPIPQGMRGHWHLVREFSSFKQPLSFFFIFPIPWYRITPSFIVFFPIFFLP